jgi:DeoR family fructose operon transcriptional repressor
MFAPTEANMSLDSPAISADDRHHALRALLKEHGRVQVADCARQWGVSEMTVRRDLRVLENEGVPARVQGGAVAQDPLRWQNRRTRATRQKQQAASKLVPLIPEQGCVFIDGSTTVLGLVEHLRQRRLTVITNSLETFRHASQVGGDMEVMLIGGRLHRETDNLVGPLANACLGTLHFDAMICSAYGLHSETGPSEPSLEDADFKRLVIERSDRVLMAVSSDKFDRRAAGVWALPASTVLATDCEPDDRRIQPFVPLVEPIL